ncbi:MAG: hypothetical protein P1U87_03130 [Verrucomicrobiales bacterium]|nr:hypothetical protein [Verrucomicrobiales bacterium]
MKATIIAAALSLSFLSASTAQDSVEIVFTNFFGAPVSLFWVDCNGNEAPYGSIPAGIHFVQPTYSGHTWNWRGAQISGQMIASAQPTQYITIQGATTTNTNNADIKVRAVTYVDSTTGRNVSIQMTGARTWAEYSPNGVFKFWEADRDEWSVYLYDWKRGISLQIDLYTNTIAYGAGDAQSGQNTEKFGAYPITSASN